MCMGEQRIVQTLHGLKPAVLMIVVQLILTGVNVLYKIASNDGMNLRVLVAYRIILATAFIIPLALFIERKNRPKLTWTILFQAFLCGLFGASLAQNLYLESLVLTSATLASAMTNLTPAITFCLALLFRLEKLNFGTSGGKAKVLGSVLGVGGALILPLYKGVEINIWSTHVDLAHRHPYAHMASPLAESGNRHVLGGLLAVACSACFSLWYITQAKMSEKYPCCYTSSALMSTMASIQTVIFALCTVRDWSQWKLDWNIRLLTIVYSGTLASGLVTILMAWCVQKKGPLYVSAFSPLLLVLVAIAGSLVLNEKLHLGSVLAGVLIVFGLYLVLWGKGKEMKMNQLPPSESFGNQPESLHIVVASPADNTARRSKSNSISSTGVVTNVVPHYATDVNVMEKDHAQDSNSHSHKKENDQENN